MLSGWQSSWRRTPRPLKRPLLWLLLPFSVVAFELFAWVWWAPLSRASWHNPGMMFLIAQVVAILLAGLTTRRVRRAFVESGGRLCTHCAHSLACLDDHGVCPECGSPYSIETDRITWGECNLTMEREVRQRDERLTLAQREKSGPRPPVTASDPSR